MAILGGVVVADPMVDLRGHEQSAIDIGGLKVLWDGTQANWYVGSRLQFHMVWKGLTLVEADMLRALYVTWGTLDWEPSEGGSFTTIIVPGSWRQRDEPTPGGFIYEVEMTLQETTAT